MKSMMRVVALMVALVMVMGWAQAIRPGVVAANEDVELLQPPPTKGDPDSGGPSRYLEFAWGYIRVSAQRNVSRALATLARRDQEKPQSSDLRRTAHRTRAR